jgi:hypothetical protein
MKSSNAATGDRHASRSAGIAALIAGICWICWAIINAMTSGGLDSGPPAIGPRLSKFGQLLTIGWNLLLIPAAVVLWQRLANKDTSSITLYTVCCIISLTFWALGAAAHVNSPMLEVSYLLLSGTWWLGVGNALKKQHKLFGTFTFIVGIFALIDAILSFCEPMPFYIYALAAPKLPLAIIWDFWLGFFLLKTANEELPN